MLSTVRDYQPGFADGYANRRRFLRHRNGVISFAKNSFYYTFTDIRAGIASEKETFHYSFKFAQ